MCSDPVKFRVRKGDKPVEDACRSGTLEVAIVPTTLWEEFLRRLPVGNGDQADSKTGLILSGGGARASYQVGVLKAIAEILPDDIDAPFEIICGTSAGAINAATLACSTPDFRKGAEQLEQAWGSFHAGRIYRTGFFDIVFGICRWLRNMMFRGGDTNKATSIFDNRPLGGFLREVVNLQKIQEAIDAGHLHALSITTAGYTSGLSHTFFQGSPDIPEWERARRIGRRASITIEHLLGSSAIPLIFPAVKIGSEYFGDGAIRQLTPISPAIHMGASRVFVIGVSEDRKADYKTQAAPHYPTLAKITGHVFDSAFLDSMQADMERLERMNSIINLIPERVKSKDGMTLRPVEMLNISPSQSLDEIAAKHADDLPRTIRYFLRHSGATRSNAASIVSYLLFEKPYCRELIQLGYRDAMEREEEIRKFLTKE
ncbi:MAG: patatin-like phospholipase family protein [Deltaproteobacteria bacterium]|nr:patatin-like phospholipase family protein [Deltaproteobacteria bacterium]